LKAFQIQNDTHNKIGYCAASSVVCTFIVAGSVRFFDDEDWYLQVGDLLERSLDPMPACEFSIQSLASKKVENRLAAACPDLLAAKSWGGGLTNRIDVTHRTVLNFIGSPEILDMRDRNVPFHSRDNYAKSRINIATKRLWLAASQRISTKTRLHRNLHVLSDHYGGTHMGYAQFFDVPPAMLEEAGNLSIETLLRVRALWAKDGLSGQVSRNLKIWVLPKEF
jgi:hypothetical protein